MRRRRGSRRKIPGISVCIASFVLAAPFAAEGQDEPITRPVISEEVSPIELVHPVATDGYRGDALLRKPPGAGPFPAVALIHGGLVTRSLDRLRAYVTEGALPSRFLETGYVVATITYRSRDHDPQSEVSRDDSMAALEYLQRLSFVDSASVGVYGCSGGGDLALAVAAEMDVAAIVAEEPASMMFTGVWNDSWPKAGERYTPLDTEPIYDDPLEYYTAEHQRLTKEKIARIRSPILIVQGDVDTRLAVNDFNAAVLIPELRSAGKALDVMTYPGAPHCFAFGSRTGSEAQAVQAFQDAEAFLRQHMTSQPSAVDRNLVTSAVLTPE